MKLDFSDIKSRLQSNVNVGFEVCPARGHNMHGKVELKIQEVKKSIERTNSHERVLQKYKQNQRFTFTTGQCCF